MSNILPHKSWHVYAQRNIDKVRRDEAAAHVEEEKAAHRGQLADQQARLQLLRDKANERRMQNTEASIQSSSEEKVYTGASIAIVPVDDNDDGKKEELLGGKEGVHVSLFSEFAGNVTENADAVKEERELQQKWEKKVGILVGLGGDTAETKQSWYDRPMESHTEDVSRLKKIAKKLAVEDPLTVMKEALKKNHNERESQDTTERRKSYSSIKKKGKQSKEAKLALLREERLQRERKERDRVVSLMNTGSKSAQSVPAESRRGYFHSQFNPTLVHESHEQRREFEIRRRRNRHHRNSPY